MTCLLEGVVYLLSLVTLLALGVSSPLGASPAVGHTNPPGSLGYRGWVYMAARTPHSLAATTPVIMLLVLLKSQGVGAMG
jgi:hypothetical protein